MLSLFLFCSLGFRRLMSSPRTLQHLRVNTSLYHGQTVLFRAPEFTLHRFHLLYY
jgi:hypothetical protein